MAGLVLKNRTVSVHMSSDGDDVNDGSVLSPVLSIARASTLALAGTTVLARGVFFPTVQGTWSKSGTPAGRIVIQPYPGETAIFDGSAIPANNTILFAADYVTMRGVEARNSTKAGIAVYTCTGVRILNCNANNCQKAGIISEGTTVNNNVDTLLEGNTVFRNALDNAGVPGWAQGITLSRGTNGRARRNNVFNNLGEGIGVQKGHVGAIVDENDLLDNLSVQIYLDAFAGGVTVKRNFALATGDPLYDNPISGGRADGISCARETGTGTLDGAMLLSNKLIGHRYGISTFIQVANSSLVNSLWGGNTIVGSILASLRVEAANASNNRIKNNACSGAINLSGDFTGYDRSHNGFFGGAGAGSNNVTADPLFINAAGDTPEDFDLQAGSPLIGAGVDVAELTEDFWGNPRLSPPAIGAHQWA